MRDKKNCDCIITTGLGENILKAVVELIEKPTKDKLTKQKIAEMVDQLLKPEWEHIGEIIVAWSCGTLKMSTAG
jgi:predicted NBD/HSP70 family sugar kinase